MQPNNAFFFADSVEDLTPQQYEVPLKRNSIEKQGRHATYDLPVLLYFPPPCETQLDAAQRAGEPAASTSATVEGHSHLEVLLRQYEPMEDEGCDPLADEHHLPVPISIQSTTLDQFLAG